MSAKRNTNVLVVQSGGPTPVINRSLVGIISEASARRGFGKLHGAVHGLDGLLDGQAIDLRKQGAAALARVARTPGAALGSTRRKLKPADVPVILERLTELGTGYLFVIGGNDSVETGLAIAREAGSVGFGLSVIHIPKTIDNDLAGTDHCPGYGSAARFVALATMGAGRDAEAMGQASPIAVIEVMGRDAGWLAAASALGKRAERDAPHVLGLPEVPVDEDRFVRLMEDAYRRYGFAVAVVAENARGLKGVLGGQARPYRVDEFDHPYFEGAGGYLARLLEHLLKVRVRCERPGTIQRSLAACVSPTDAEEAEVAGRAAVRYALEGHAGVMVSLVRESERPYHCVVGIAPLEQVAGQVKRMPGDYLDHGRYFVRPAFARYARPLVGPLPLFGRLDTPRTP
ncbi:MAG: diphosphate--fructose-6-phosphate 1-phosphotransferase [SAR202 cluster bacterium]|nr:diphosphate--fructose-6-phosphate 1-phosphotransferase [SAR202 cluster bacterium]